MKNKKFLQEKTMNKLKNLLIAYHSITPIFLTYMKYHLNKNNCCFTDEYTELFNKLLKIYWILKNEFNLVIPVTIYDFEKIGIFID